MNILITGSSSGIGFGLTRTALQDGHRVFGISRRPVKHFEHFRDYRHLLLNIADDAAVRRLLPEFLSSCGLTPRSGATLDLIILNAGILGPVKRMDELGIPAIKEVMETNVWSNKRLLDLLFNQGIPVTQVVGISSGASQSSTPGWGAYALSKAALNMLMNVYAQERPATHFSALAPGLVDSEIQDSIYRMQETEKYPVLKKLQDARFSDAMPDPLKAAPKLFNGMRKALELPSGSYLDIREI